MSNQSLDEGAQNLQENFHSYPNLNIGSKTDPVNHNHEQPKMLRSVKKQRLLARKGTSRFSKPLNSLAFFLSDSKLCYTVDFNGERFFLDETLSEIEKLLDPRLFFRISRQLIIHIDAIREFKSIEYSKIELYILPNSWIKQPVIISQKTAPQFKKWIMEL